MPVNLNKSTDKLAPENYVWETNPDDDWGQSSPFGPVIGFYKISISSQDLHRARQFIRMMDGAVHTVRMNLGNNADFTVADFTVVGWGDVEHSELIVGEDYLQLKVVYSGDGYTGFLDLEEPL